jgi:hypothetical protein
MDRAFLPVRHRQHSQIARLRAARSTPVVFVRIKLGLRPKRASLWLFLRTFVRRVMKTKLLGLIVAVATLGAWPAYADTYSLNLVLPNPTSLTITGTITTSADTGYLTSSNLVSWALTASNNSNLMGSVAQNGVNGPCTGGANGVQTQCGEYDIFETYQSPLVQTSSNITFTPLTTSSDEALILCNYICSAPPQNYVIPPGAVELVFSSYSPFYTGPSSVENYITWDEVDPTTYTLSPTGPLVIGTDETTTPLPPALPLFAAGLGVMGLLARRRKRKDVAALAAA